MYTHKYLDRIFNVHNSELNVVRRNIFSYTYFYANICQVCQRHNREVPFVTCDNCKMVSYCSTVHQEEHRPLHRGFCKVMRNFQIFWTFKIPFQETGWNVEKHLKWTNNVIEYAETTLNRKLLPCEKQMIQYPKVCEVCNQVDSDENKLISCENCPHANFCIWHYKSPNHHIVCYDYVISCICDAYTVLCEDKLFLPKIGILPFKLSDEFYWCNVGSHYYQCKKFFKFPTNIYDYLELIFKILEQGSPDYGDRCHVAMYLCNFASYPLTLIYVLMMCPIQFMDKLFVHVIGTTTEMEFLDIWELVLHLVPQLTLLHLTFIGSECDVSCFSPRLCNVCTLQCKKIVFYSCDYKEYCESDYFTKPNLVLGYNIEIETSDTWKKFLRSLNCPFVLTASSQSSANLQQIQIQRISDSSYFSEILNPYRSIRPSRDYLRNTSIFVNSFITIYPGLVIKNNEIENESKKSLENAVYEEELKKNKELKLTYP